MCSTVDDSTTNACQNDNGMKSFLRLFTLSRVGLIIINELCVWVGGCNVWTLLSFCCYNMEIATLIA